MYSDELTKSMTWLGEQEDTVFLGQGVSYPGHAMFKTLEYVSMDKRIELPVAEEMQMGMSIGLALTGKTVISIYPRFDFLLLAMNQLVNHLDKLEEFTHGQYKAKVIVRVGIGSDTPLNPGCQHTGDYTRALVSILKTVRVNLLLDSCDILPHYKEAYSLGKAVMVEHMSLYHTDKAGLEGKYVCTNGWTKW